MKRARLQPVCRKGWIDYYIREFNKTQREGCAHLAMWYMFLDLSAES